MRALGLSSAAVRSRADARVWTTVTDEVLVRVGSHPGPAQRAMAAVLDAGPGAVLSFQSGAAWYRVAGAQMSTVHTLSTVHSRRRSVLSDVHIVRVVPAPRVTVLDGIPIARPELIALHLFASEPPARAERWVERMWSMRLLSGASIARFLSAMGRRGRNGTAGLRRYLDARPADYTPSATGLELRARDVLLLAGFDVRAQVSSGGDVWTGRVDLRDAAHPVILEVQSAMYHDALVDREADAKRLAQLRADGFVVVEVTDTIVFHDTDELVRRYREGVKEAERRSGLRLVPPTCSVAQNRGEPRGSAQQNGGGGGIGAGGQVRAG